MEATKVCIRCNIEKSTTDFFERVSQGKRYLRGMCKSCYREDRRVPKSDVAKEARKERHRKAGRQLRERYHAGDVLIVARSVLSNCKRTDKKKKLTNDLDIDYVLNAIQRPCQWCGIFSSEHFIGLDRLYNDVGHTKANCVPCCTRCNMIKGNMPLAAWEVIAPAVSRVVNEGLFGEWKGPTLNRSILSQ